MMDYRNKSLIEFLKIYHHICWYMSAGADFRPLLFLSDAFYSSFSKHMELGYPDDAEKVIPDLFVFTDRKPIDGAYYYNDLVRDGHNDDHKDNFIKVDTDINNFIDESRWKDVRKLFVSKCGSHRGANGIEEKQTSIEALEAPIKLSDDQMNAYFINVRIISWWFGKRYEWKTSLLYVICENENFYGALNGNVAVESMILIRPEILVCPSTGRELAKQIANLKVRFLLLERSFVDGCFTSDEELLKMQEFYRVEKAWATRSPVIWYKLNRV